jgi:hypothetical protein
MVARTARNKKEDTMFMKTTAPIPSIDYMTAPMALDELEYMANHSDDGQVTAIIGISLDKVAGGDYEDFLDLVTACVCGDQALLSDISTSIVGVDIDEGLVLVKVSGSLESFDDGGCDW